MPEAAKSTSMPAPARRAPVPRRMRTEDHDEAVPAISPDAAFAPHRLQALAGNAATHALVAQASDLGADDGRPMDAGVRGEMESHFRTDLGFIRLHTSARAASSAERLNANAYAAGHDIAFGPGQYEPRTPEGRRLLAHEIAHVIQQSRRGSMAADAPAAEREAESAGLQVAGGGAAQVTQAVAPGIALDEKKPNPRLESFYKPSFFGNRTFDQKGIPGGPAGVWPYDDHLRDLWLDVDTGDPAAYLSEEFQDFADTVKEYQMAVMGFKWSDRGAHGVVDAVTAASLITHPIATKKTPAVTAPTPAPGKVFDDAYKLADGKATGYDPQTRIVTLSPADKAHLVRLHGYYLFLAHDVYTLIVPPEGRGPADALDDVFIGMTRFDLLKLDGTGDPASTITDIFKRNRGEVLPSATASTQPDYDFAIDRYKPAGAERTALEHARRRALSTPQQPTIESAAQQGLALPQEKLSGMDPDTLINRMDTGERAGWYIKMLGSHQDQLYQSALNHNIPMQLLAVVILNELSDIGGVDLLQDGTPVADSGSLGIAQIQVSTAMKDRLVDVDDADALAAYGRRDGSFSFRLGGPVDDAEKLRKGRVYRTAEQLQTPQFAIEATAREIAILLRKMGQNLDKPWQKNNGFLAAGPSGSVARDYIPGNSNTDMAEATLAQVVVAAYNSPDIIITEKDAEEAYSNGYIHGMNARVLAFDLYNAKLFRTD